MIDSDDADEMLTAGIFSEGWFALVILVLALVFYFLASGNEKECAKQKCQNGTPAVLMDHECRCVTTPVKE